MSILKPNARVIEKALKGPKALFRIEGRPGLWLSTRGDGNGSWRIKYRPKPGAIQQWHTLTNDARNTEFADVAHLAEELLTNVKLRRIDPKAAIREAKAQAEQSARTVEIAFNEWLDHPGRRRALADRTKHEYRRLFALHLAPRIGETPLAALDRNAIETFLEQVRKATTDSRRGHRGLQATKCRQILSAVFRHGLKKRWTTTNPVDGVDLPVPKQNPEGKASRPLTDDELRKVWRGCIAEMGASSARVLKLALLLGRRVSEIIGTKRDELRLNGKQSVWIIPADREGNKSKQTDLVPLPRMAVAIFQEAIAAAEGSPYLFPARGLPDRPMSRHTPSQAFTDFRRAIGIDDTVRLHDSRRLLNDRMSALRVPAEYRSRVLHHTGDFNDRLADSVYSEYEFIEEKHRALRLWAIRLQEIVQGRRPHTLRWNP
jgi:integrase